MAKGVEPKQHQHAPVPASGSRSPIPAWHAAFPYGHATPNITAGQALEQLKPASALRPDELQSLGLDTQHDSPTVAFNPFVFPAGDRVLLNLKCDPRADNCTDFPGIANTKVLELTRHARKRSELVHQLPNAEDARGVVWRGRHLAIFTRYAAHKRKDPWLAHLDPPASELKLRYPQRTVSEGNWLPFVFDDQLYASYTICPHRVVAIDAHTGNVSLAFETQPASCSRHDHGSASGFTDTDGTVVGLGHQKGPGIGRKYWFFFFKRSARPPFEMVNRSGDFRLPSFFFERGPAKGDFVQFSLSLRLGPAESVVLDYSVLDKAALTLELPRPAFCNFTQWCAW